jgi:hypothetical protein
MDGTMRRLTTTQSTHGSVRLRRGVLLVVTSLLLALPAAVLAQESSFANAVLQVGDLLRDPFAGEVTVRGVAGQIGWARVPRGVRATWAIVPPGGGAGVAVADTDDPGLGAYIELCGEVRLDRFDGIPYLANVRVEELHELPMWERPLDRQTLMALIALLLPPTALLLVATALRIHLRRPQPATPALFARKLEALPADVTPLVEAPLPAGLDADAGATLVVSVRSGPDEGRRFTTTRRSVTLGRRPDRDIALTDRSVARFEATLVQHEGRVIVRAESPHTTVLVNGRPINEGLVAEGDVLRVGMTELAIAREESAPKLPVQP